jgi:hypothetical protein
MSETPKRLKPTFETFRELFLKSGNLCAFPGCTALMMNEDGLFIGQLCHIEAAEPGGERFNPSMTNEERRSAPNLLLMCYPHHRETNDVTRYTVADLKGMKGNHERRFSRPDRAMRERVARLNRAALVGAGIGVGMSIDNIAAKIRSVLTTLVQPAREPDPKPDSIREKLLNVLRFAPRGTVHCYSRDPLHLSVGEAFLELFQESGWYVSWLSEPPTLGKDRTPDFNHSMLMLFTVRDQHQQSNAKAAVDEFFDLAGFERSEDTDVTSGFEEGKRLRFYIPVGIKPPR